MDRRILLATIGSDLVLTGVVPSGRQGSAWAATFTAHGGTGQYAIRHVGGVLPTGAAFLDNGDGTAQITAAALGAPGVFAWQLELEDTITRLRQRFSFATRVTREVPLAILGSLAPTGKQYATYAGGTLTGQGVFGTALWRYLGDTPGITIKATGKVGGTPLFAGSRVLTFELTDSADGARTTRSFPVAITVAAPPPPECAPYSPPGATGITFRVDETAPEGVEAEGNVFRICSEIT